MSRPNGRSGTLTFRRFRCPAGLLYAAILVVPVPGCRDAEPREALWVGRLGSDTVIVEGARRTGSRIDGTIVNVAAGMLIQRYEADLDADGTLLSLRSWTLPDASAAPDPDQTPSLVVEVGDDSIRVTRSGADGPVESAIPAVEGAVPLFDAFFNNPMALTELALRAADRRDGGAVRFYYVGSPSVDELPVTRTGSGAASFPYALARQYPMMADAHLHATMDGGSLARFDARETTFKIVTERHPWTDPLALGRRFEERGLGEGGFAGLSPPRTASGRIGTVDVEVAYGQPSRRGRRIFPDVVPFGTVWRAGANAATEVTFSADAVVGGQPVPAGSYSVWVIPGARADTLILNEATQIWGVSYDAERDFVRVPLIRELVDEPIESLTYAVSSSGDEGRLELAWGDRRFSVGIQPATSSP